jgi:V/A-type H+/Na+-transporting ATPase subunit D
MPAEFEPTKANLIRLKGELLFAREGYEILDRKREILLKELTAVAARYDLRKEALTRRLRTLYADFDIIRRLSGPLAHLYESIQKPDAVSIEVSEEGIMGVHVARLAASQIKIPLHAAPHAATQSDRFVREYAEIIPMLLAFAEAASSLRRLAREAARTQKLLKALENIHIPSYEKGIAFITSSLEENERDELNRYKKLKRKL